MLWPAMATSSILLLTIVLSLLFSIEFRINEATAKKCTDKSMDNETTSSCGSQGESNTFTSSLRGSDSNTKDVNNNGGDVSIIHTKSKHFNHESSNGDSENDTPFALPFP
jgi:hypothetical protein